mmetsp:Transcript_108590/g.315838  ORF Transcript_108590/g.315838 Transcript_108590/m.315838 type:complete len:80 (+) Transcript_108590:305-544(+)
MEVMASPRVLETLCVDLESLVVHSYTRQVVAGTKYQVKLAREDGTFSHFSVIKPLPHKNEEPFILGEVQDGLTAEDTFN